MSEANGQALELDGLGLGLQQESSTDNELVRDFIAGNDAAFTQLVTKYKERILIEYYLQLLVFL